ncbi:MAG: hypothetical protein KY446_03260 [Proteobacteria bacterium]|nr:hypothetical protein [Pseudomonadota bacterium]
MRRLIRPVRPAKAHPGPGRDHDRLACNGLTGPRPDGAIGFAVLPGGGAVGEHSVMLAAEDEITLSHSARDRALFARGASAAGAWVAARPPGLYDRQDVLGLKP